MFRACRNDKRCIVIAEGYVYSVNLGRRPRYTFLTFSYQVLRMADTEVWRKEDSPLC
jgi:hypothetical protein